jgi:hypothetical protein
MSKYDSLKSLKGTKARADHVCCACGTVIHKGDVYYREHIAARFLNVPHLRKFCGPCFRIHGDELLRAR